MSISHPPIDLDEFEFESESEAQSGPPPEEVRDGIHYPSSDGEEMGESGWHLVAMTTLFSMLRRHFSGQDVYVAADMMLYYEEGNPRAVRAPDCMVVLGVKNHQRRSWLAWEEGALPSVVFEVASAGTFRQDLGAKRRVYEKLGIPEYFLFDPIALSDSAHPLRGFRLREGRYVAIPRDERGGLVSERLGMLIYPEVDILRLVDLQTHRPLLTDDEVVWRYERQRRLIAARKRLVKAAQRRSAFALFTAKLRAEVERRRARVEREQAEADRNRAEAEHQKAEAERQKAESERQKAEAERSRADRLAVEVERLRAILGLKEDENRGQ